MTIVNVKVSGVVYEIDSDLLTGESQRFTQRPGRLPEIVKSAVKRGDELEFVFSRPYDIFGAILGFYQTDELHMPMWICPGAFRKELEFWGIDTSYLESCCKTRYNSFMDEQKLVSEFHNEMYGGATLPTSGLSWRQKVWLVVDNQSKSPLARVYFAVTLIAVLVSIIGIGLGTDSCCMRAVTVCELKEYLKSAQPEGYKHVLKKLNPGNCRDTDLASYFDSQDELYFYLEVNSPPPESPSNEQPPPPPPPQQQQPPNEGITIQIPKLKRRLLIFDLIDYVTLMFFTVDFVFRIFTCPSLLAFVRSVVNYFDFFALVGTYIHLIITQLKKEEKYEDNWIDALEYLQVLRSLRLLRLVKNLRTSQVLVFSLRKNFKDLSILAMFLFIGVCTFGSLLYFSEERSRVVSIPTGWWWSLVTMTTVGYGDITPASGPGKMIGSVCALSGVVLLSLTLPIFVNNFLILYQYAGHGSREEYAAREVKCGKITPVLAYTGENKVAM